MTIENVNFMKNDYVLKLLDSLSMLKNCLDSIAVEIEEAPNEQYIQLTINSHYRYRCDWLNIMSLTMSKEEKELWKDLGCNIVDD